MTDTEPSPATADPAASSGEGPARRSAIHRVVDAVKVPALALVGALVAGGIVIVATDPDSRYAWARFFNDPLRALRESWEAIAGAYGALFAGAFGSVGALSETLTRATPLMLAGLGVAFAFKAGLFNIGGSGQFILGTICAGYLGFTLDLPGPLLIVVAFAAGVLGGALWGGIAGALKAYTGAHEVISTIMLNYIAVFFLDWLLSTRAFLRPNRNDPISKPVPEDTRFPGLLDGQRVHLGLLIALAVVVLVWWLLYKSTFGYKIRALGANPGAVDYAGVSSAVLTVVAMLIAGGLAGMAGAIETLSVRPSLTGGLTMIGFNAIAVALLGRSNPFGVVAAAILFGGLEAGATRMQVETGTPADLIGVIQALIILFVAAPLLVRALFRVRDTGGTEATFTTSWGK